MCYFTGDLAGQVIVYRLQYCRLVSVSDRLRSSRPVYLTNHLVITRIFCWTILRIRSAQSKPLLEHPLLYPLRCSDFSIISRISRYYDYATATRPLHNDYGPPLRKSQRLKAVRADAKESNMGRPQTLGIATAEAGGGTDDMPVTATPIRTCSKSRQER